MMKVRTIALPMMAIGVLLICAAVFLTVALAGDHPDPCEMPEGHPDPVGWMLYC